MEYSSYMIIGAARSGIASCLFLAERDEVKSIILTDTKTEDKLLEEKYGIEDVLNNDRITKILGRQPSNEEVDGCDCIVLSPGVPPTIPPIKRANEKGIKVLSEIEFANRYFNGTIVGITGTNGKTTTTTLTGKLFTDAGLKAATCGNIGDPFINYAKSGSIDTAVMELSSFQLDMTEKLHPHIAVITNLTPDHLDRHKTFENYVAAKAKIFMNMTEDDYLILNDEDEYVKALKDKTKAKVLFFTTKDDPTKDAYLSGSHIHIRLNGNDYDIADFDHMKILGKHNAANSMCASLCAALSGISIESITKTLYDFVAVEHRIEYTCTKNGVDYINDSKGTNPDATIIAVRAMKKPTVLILGGYDKHNSFDELMEEIQKSGMIKHMVVFGATKDQIVEALNKYELTNYTVVDTYDEVLHTCTDIATEGDCVLLSPACASWDMFPDYEVRGRMFKAYANSL